MKKLLLAGLLGAAVGALLVIALERRGPLVAAPAAGDGASFGDVTRLSSGEARALRETHYETLETVEELLALPSAFARREALYTLAGRADSADVQRLIYEADRISDRIERNAALIVLFARLTEIDPQTALAIARGGAFANEASVEAQVWRSWAKADFSAALAAADDERDWAKRNRATQALLSAYGYLGNARTDEIVATLGVDADTNTLGRYLYLLAEQSPEEAIAYVNGLVSASERNRAANWLANYMARADPQRAATYTDSIDDLQTRTAFGQAVQRVAAAADPAATLEEVLSEPATNESRMVAHSALGALAKQDIEAALGYYERVRSQQLRYSFGTILIEALAKTDPARALAWARANEQGGQSFLLASAIQHVAMSDQETARAEIAKITNKRKRSEALQFAVSALAQNSPERAAAMLDGVDDVRDLESIASTIVATWARVDPTAALDWASSREDIDTSAVLRGVGMQLAMTDPEQAMRLLPRLDPQTARVWHQSIASTLARTAPERAVQFLNRFGGTDEYSNLQSTVIGGIAESDMARARSMADRLPDTAARDEAYAQLVAQQAYTDPAEAARWLDTITDRRQQEFAARQLAEAWYEMDPAAALAWTRELPIGPQRDYAIMGLASNEPGPELRSLIDSIDDEARRGQAVQMLVFSAARTDWREAQSILDAADLPAEQRESAQRMIDQLRAGGL